MAASRQRAASPPFDRLRPDLPQRPLAAAVPARELLAELRRHPAEQRQLGGVFDEAPQPLGAALLVPADDDDPGELDAAREQPEPAGPRAQGGSALARVDDQHERRVQSERDVEGS